ncbi:MULTISPECIES: DUF2721 domain-containing protein [Bradyrhizobium]|uniref:DUF2721 domain-containing protein n=1 Tax=Bradyrhizobium TaxID=374 RepID=UPI001144CFDE
MFSTISAIPTCLLVIVAFVSTYFQLRHEYGVAILFIVALGSFTAALIDLVRERGLPCTNTIWIARNRLRKQSP